MLKEYLPSVCSSILPASSDTHANFYTAKEIPAGRRVTSNSYDDPVARRRGRLIEQEHQSRVSPCENKRIAVSSVKTERVTDIEVIHGKRARSWRW